MKALLIALALPALAGNSQAPAPIPSQATIDWLKLYPVSPYREYWSADLEIKSLAADLPRIVAALEKAGGAPLVPLANTIVSPTAGTQQLSYRFTKRNAEAAVKALRKVGKMPAPRVRPSGDLIPLDEIKTKIEALSRDKQANSGVLSAMPAVSSLVDSMLGHLLTVQAVAEKVEQEVVLNLTLQQRKSR
jgi:hypothetical protein